MRCELVWIAVWNLLGTACPFMDRQGVRVRRKITKIKAVNFEVTRLRLNIESFRTVSSGTTFFFEAQPIAYFHLANKWLD